MFDPFCYLIIVFVGPACHCFHLVGEGGKIVLLFRCFVACVLPVTVFFFFFFFFSLFLLVPK